MKLSLLVFSCLVLSMNISYAEGYRVKVNTEKEPTHKGKYTQTTESLSDYVCPEWFRNVKFGIWAHWGPQCQPEDGDWYARQMYIEGSDQYKYQIDAMGHPSEFGFKDWIPLWKAEKWNPDSLVSFYKEVGARYFFTLANHHDNLDLYDSKYQPWNTTNMGPHKDIVGGWAEACRKYGLYLETNTINQSTHLYETKSCSHHSYNSVSDRMQGHIKGENH